MEIEVQKGLIGLTMTQSCRELPRELSHALSITTGIDDEDCHCAYPFIDLAIYLVFY